MKVIKKALSDGTTVKVELQETELPDIKAYTFNLTDGEEMVASGPIRYDTFEGIQFRLKCIKSAADFYTQEPNCNRYKDGFPLPDFQKNRAASY